MAEDKKQRVLDEANIRFNMCQNANLPPVISNACPIIAQQLGMAAAEVNALLRILHREGKIGLVSYQKHVNIAPNQRYLAVYRDITTSGGRTKRTVSSVSEPRPTTVSAEPTETSRLRARIQQLTQAVDSLQDKLNKSVRHHAAANRKREEALREQRRSDDKLTQALATIRRLEAELAAARGAQDRIAELEGQLEATHSNVVSPEVIAALTKFESNRNR
jgi:hypothetical protein